MENPGRFSVSERNEPGKLTSLFIGSEKKRKKIKEEKLVALQKEASFQLESSDKTAKLDTSQWPLLLKVTSNNQAVTRQRRFFRRISTE